LASPLYTSLIDGDKVAWSVGLSVGLSPSEPCKNDWSDRDAVCVEDSGGPRETRVAYSGPLGANTVLCSFNTIQPTSYFLCFIRNYEYDLCDKNFIVVVCSLCCICV